MERSGHGLLSAPQAGWSLADLCLWDQAQLEPFLLIYLFIFSLSHCEAPYPSSPRPLPSRQWPMQLRALRLGHGLRTAATPAMTLFQWPCEWGWGQAGPWDWDLLLGLS